MAITQRLRYEILRRDNHRCKYCGASADDAKLTVDHVIPKALGGSDEPSNLVAACQPCNSGKSSASADSTLVDDVRADAARYKAIVESAYALLVDRAESRDAYRTLFIAAYAPHTTVPVGWQDSVGRFCDIGVPVELVEEAAEIAARQPASMDWLHRFKYFCKIVWNRVDAVNAAVNAATTDAEALTGAFHTPMDLHMLTDQAQEDGWRDGWEWGYKRGLEAAAAAEGLSSETVPV